MMKRLGFALALALASCATNPPKPDGVATCATACAQGRALGCSYGLGDGTTSCEVICEHSAAVGQPWRLECLAAVDSCDPLACP